MLGPDFIFDRCTPEPNSGCWIWLLSLNKDGYGRLVAGGFSLAHRASWSIANGPIPEGHDIHHKCRVKCCVNPDHLKPMTYAAHRAADFPDGTTNQNTFKTHCTKGHLLAGRNLIIERTRVGHGVARRCRECRTAEKRRRRAAKAK